MNDQKSTPNLKEDLDTVELQHLQVRVVSTAEQPEAQRLLNLEHYLGAPPTIGKNLTLVVHFRGRWVALFEVGPAALKLKDRDEWIGWTPQQQTERLNLVLQNRRFLVLSDAHLPNLASRALSLAIGALPEAWEKAHGWRPLLVETFVDLEQFSGTCYKADNWIACGFSKGYERHRADFYHYNGNPKKLMLKLLHRQAKGWLCGIQLPRLYDKGVNRHNPLRNLPLNTGQMGSLKEALRKVPDPRKVNRKFPISSLLSLVCIALLAGRKNLAEIVRYGQLLTQPQRALLDWPLKAGKRFRPAPSYTAFYNLLRQLDGNALAQCLTTWLEAGQGTLPRALAIDGKRIRDLVLTVCLSDHDSGVPAAMLIAQQCSSPPATTTQSPSPVDGTGPATQTELTADLSNASKPKDEGELKIAQRLIKQMPTLENAIVTGDALYCEAKTMLSIVDKAGDYVVQLKGNQPTALEHCKRVAKTHTPLFRQTLRTKATDA